MPAWTLRTAGAALTILVAGCGSHADETAGAVSPQEAQALNDAAAMLDDNGQDASQDTAVSNDAAPASENAQ